MDKLLTQDEAAELLRCSPTKVKRLRLDGKLAYIPGRPVFITERALEMYIERETIAAADRPRPAIPQYTQMSAQEAAMRWAQRTVLLQRQSPKKK